MPYHLEFDSEHRILLVIFEGEVHGWEISEASNEVRPRFSDLNASAVISDLSAVTNADFTGSMVRHQAKVDVSYLQKVAFIMVAPRTHLYGLARMYELSANPSFAALRVVHSREEAFAALDVQDPKFDRVTLRELLGQKGDLPAK